MGCPSRLNHRSILSSQWLAGNSQQKSITNTKYAILTASLLTIRDSEFTGTKINKSVSYEMKKWMTVWVDDSMDWWLHGWMTPCMGDCMGAWLHGWMTASVDDSMDKRLHGWMRAWVDNTRIDNWMNDCMEWKYRSDGVRRRDGWMKVGVKERMNELIIHRNKERKV